MEPAIFGAVTNDNAPANKENNPSLVAYPNKNARGAVPPDTSIGEPSAVEGMLEHADKSPGNPLFKEASPEKGKCNSPEGNPGMRPPMPESDDRVPLDCLVLEKSSKYPEARNSKGPGTDYPKRGAAVVGATS